MSASWSEGYFTETTYCMGYHREQSPAFQRFCLLLAGYDAPEGTGSGINCCELGFGQGLSLNIHAASVPGNWYGNDFNPEHVCFASTLGRSGGSGVQVFDDAFADFCYRDDLPDFDYISLHGIWTWVSAVNRKHILHLLEHKLRPGGIVYVSYNCHPGMGTMAPLRQMLYEYDRLAGHTHTGSRVGAALEFARKFMATESSYKTHHVHSALQLENLLTLDHSYLAHEHLNQAWDVMYFSEVAEIMNDIRLHFAASAYAPDNVKGFGYSNEAIGFLDTIESPVLREQMKDYYANNMFRRDLFVRGGMKLDPTTQIERLMNTRMALCSPPDVATTKVSASMGEVSLDEKAHRPLIELLAEDNHRPRTLHEIQRCAGGNLGEGQLIATFAALIGTGHVAPCQNEADEIRAEAVCHRLNTRLLQYSRSADDLTSLASPVLGTGMSITRLNQLFQSAVMHGLDPVREAQLHLKNEGRDLYADGVKLTDEAAVTASLQTDYAQFQRRQPIYRALKLFPEN